MTAIKVVVDCVTGEALEVPLTKEEQAELDARVPEPMPDPAPDPLATLLADLSKATTLAQVRAAAVNAKERTRLPVSESPSVRDSPRE